MSALRIVAAVLCGLLLAGSVEAFREDAQARARVLAAFEKTSIRSRKPAAYEAARLAPSADHAAEIFAAAAVREWLARGHRDEAVERAMAGRAPWGYPPPWPRPFGDYAAEYLAAIQDLEAVRRGERMAEGSDRDLELARELMEDAVRRRPRWPQLTRTFGAVRAAIARSRDGM